MGPHRADFMVKSTPSSETITIDFKEHSNLSPKAWQVDSGFSLKPFPLFGGLLISR